MLVIPQQYQSAKSIKAVKKAAKELQYKLRCGRRILAKNEEKINIIGFCGKDSQNLEHLTTFISKIFDTFQVFEIDLSA